MNIFEPSVNKLATQLLKLEMKNLKYILILVIATTFSGCSVYNFTGTGAIDAKTFQVNFFQNNADLVEPGIDRQFTLALQDLIMNQTNLNLVSNSGDLVYEGEIVDYRITPMTATAADANGNLGASQNRLTIRVNVRFSNRKKEKDDFEKPFEFYYDFPGADLPTGAVLNTAIQTIFERITQDIFNESLAKW
ncbi:lipopolysaccharide assembly protein [Flavobacterium cutihirudinis]|uniref:Lipopolysaccharide assembly protein n=2 Tax=Flavobacterium cutihirudinis TaxID=1265740 RepID=A0A3D9FP33_9FLAO|nr:lipopolysaccharide assembly protein [Flavobacterium cutihirudinis]